MTKLPISAALAALCHRCMLFVVTKRVVLVELGLGEARAAQVEPEKVSNRLAVVFGALVGVARQSVALGDLFHHIAVDNRRNGGEVSVADFEVLVEALGATGVVQR